MGFATAAATRPPSKNVAPPAFNAALSSGFMASKIKCSWFLPMEEIKYVSLSKFQIEPSIDDKFWLEKTKRAIQECDSVSTLKEMATLLAQIATNRQGCIRGLVQDMFIFNNMAVEQDDLANPPVTPSK
jgi:hypothetical protein